MKTQSCKAKGRKLQQETVATIKQAFPELKDNDVQSVSMGTNGEDIVMSPLAESVFPYSVECKNVERLNIWKAIEQSEGNAPRGKTPLLAIRKNRTKAFAVVPWDHFMNLVTTPRGSHDDCTKKNSTTGEGSTSSDSITDVDKVQQDCGEPSKRRKVAYDEDVMDKLRYHISQMDELLIADE